MSETQELEIAKKTAGDLENCPWWRSRMPYLTPVGYSYVKGEARRYYKDRHGSYYYRRVTESEMHRRAW